MDDVYQSFENPEDGKKFYLALDDDNTVTLVNLDEFLKINYPSLYESIQSNNISYDTNSTFFLFKELIFEGEIIGFVSYDLLDEFEDNNIIILDNYFFTGDYGNYVSVIDDMIETGFSLGFQIIIKYPTRKFIEALIDTEFAYRIDNKLVFSEIPFMTDTVGIDTSINNVIDDVNIKEYSKSYTISSLYDLDLCGVVTLTPHPDKIFNNQELTDDNMNDYCSLSMALQEDDDEYSCMKKRRKNKLLKNNKYFININEILTEYENKHK